MEQHKVPAGSARARPAAPFAKAATAAPAKVRIRVGDGRAEPDPS